MHRLAIREHNDAQPAPTRFFYSSPTTDTAVCLPALVVWARDYPSNPSFTDADAVATTSNDVEVLRSFHALKSQTPRMHIG